MLRTGELAPELILPDQHGQLIDLAAVRGRKNVVLFFYPRDNSLVCTKEACAFHDAYADIQGHDAEVIGVSRDGAASHQAFADRWRLPFTLVSDTDGEVAKRFKVHAILGLVAGRVTYVIDKEGRIAAAFRHAFATTGHVEAALEALRDQRSV